ncbi:hypothetical protein [Mesonia maritima]|uniref:Uncharacterized protein YfaP (DUF2135 family) n=1 Tax=Mesonia maritima TaxID=1793873 RepID=A0ABU1K8L3_9FLAO|nr:hypothetical protein [Mesonia maritima]MDR6300913.1 uncharacterized protein YfaP (DUF2135 family) [Mesonia maritima]
MKNSILYLHFLIAFFSFITLFSCDHDDNTEKDLIGNEGNPRFNLEFDRSNGADLDLYVKTPNNVMMYFANPIYEGGKVDVDCLCGNCPDGPVENIYWEDGTAPIGKYEYWVEYYDSCNEIQKPTDFTLRVTKNGKLIALHNGTIEKGTSTKFIHQQ